MSENNVNTSGRLTTMSARIRTAKSWRILSNNLMTKMGLASVAFWGLTFLIFMLRDITSNAFEENPYAGILIYILIPVLFWSSVFFSIVGMIFKSRRIKKHPEELLPTHVQKPVRRPVMAAAFLGTGAWLLISAFGAYKSYHATATTGFCGSACHVMKPEHSAFLHSSHDRISCPQCHIGSEVSSAIEAKTNGIKQVWEVATNSYHTPIKTPLAHPRSAKSTCGQCHAPDRMRGDVTRTFTHYSKDAENTPVCYKLLFNVTTGSGVHWHVAEEHKVSYFAADADLQEIPFVRHTKPDGSIVEFIAPKFDKSSMDETKLRTMTCTDCHNRVGHNFKTPSQAVSFAMGRGKIPANIPFIAREAIKALGQKYATTDEALTKINASLDQFYAASPPPPAAAALLPKAKEGIAEIYRINFFPEMNVDARGFNDNLGHFEFKGCERCHDSKHTTVDKSKSINKKCDLCHLIIGQAMNADELAKMTVGLNEFKHPDDPVSLKKACSSCHALKKEKE